MKRMIFPLLIAVMAVAVIASAQDQNPSMGKNMPAFSDIDLDHDEAISSEEFYQFRAERIAKHAEEGRKMKNLANAPSFDDLDTNGDGAISSEEFAAHQAEHRMNKGKS